MWLGHCLFVRPSLGDWTGPGLDLDCLLVRKHEHTRVHVCVSIDRIVDIHLSL